MKYQVIVADPAWSFSDKLRQSETKRSSNDQYSTLSIADIKKLEVNKIADPKGCVLGLWVPSSLLTEGLEVMKAWGFAHKQTHVWVKVKKDASVKKIISNKNLDLNELLAFGMGRLFRQCHEIALIGINSNNIYKSLKNKSQRSVHLYENSKHSKKPELFQDYFEKMFPGPGLKYLELFARRLRPNWTCLGNEVCNGEDIRKSIRDLIDEENIIIDAKL
jgi:N6-adenosine-specific RNA methylase IME4